MFMDLVHLVRCLCQPSHPKTDVGPRGFWSFDGERTPWYHHDGATTQLDCQLNDHRSLALGDGETHWYHVPSTNNYKSYQIKKRSLYHRICLVGRTSHQISGVNHLSEWSVHRYDKPSAPKQSNCHISIVLCMLEIWHCFRGRFNFT